MKTLVLATAFAVLCLAAHVAAERDLLPTLKWPPEPGQCGTGEVWKECVSGSCAEKSCRRRQVGPGCTLDCRYGCYCADGFYRNADGACVTIDECPPGEQDQSQPPPPSWMPQAKPCEEGEVWKRCVSSSCAEETCERPGPMLQCTADCRHGCYCGAGFYRNSEGRCVPLSECPQAQVEEATQDID